MSNVITNRLPSYFHTVVHPMRWCDPYVVPGGEERKVLTPAEISRKVRRDEAYADWIGRFSDRSGRPLLKGKQMKWQVIQILRFKHSEFSRRDWWERYQDCLFRVFLQPETFYDEPTGENKQWYLLCPEDCELVHRWELEKKGPTLPPRDYEAEPFFSNDRRLRRALLVPVECCRHWRHETTAGKLPEGL